MDLVGSEKGAPPEVDSEYKRNIQEIDQDVFDLSQFGNSDVQFPDKGHSVSRNDVLIYSCSVGEIPQTPPSDEPHREALIWEFHKI